MKRVDVELLNSRIRERERKIQDGIMAEKIEGEGKTLADLKKDALSVLGLDEGLVTIEYETIIKKQNVQSAAFIALVNFRTKALETGLVSKEELDSIKVLENKIANVLAKRLNVEIEDLYTDGEE